MKTLILLGLLAWALSPGSGGGSAPSPAPAERRTDAAVRNDPGASPSRVRALRESMLTRPLPAQPLTRSGYRPRIMTATPQPEYQPHIIMTEPWKPGDGPLQTYLGPRGEQGREEVPVIPDVTRPVPRGGGILQR